jgi:hypothetical protein
MSFIVAGCALLLALLSGIVLDDGGVRRRQTREAISRSLAGVERKNNLLDRR